MGQNAPHAAGSTASNEVDFWSKERNETFLLFKLSLLTHFCNDRFFSYSCLCSFTRDNISVSCVYVVVGGCIIKALIHDTTGWTTARLYSGLIIIHPTGFTNGL
jgi:hypothetical protein